MSKNLSSIFGPSLISLPEGHPTIYYLKVRPIFDQILLLFLHWSMSSAYTLSDLLYLIFSNFSKTERLRNIILGKLIYALNPLNLIDLLTILGGYPALRGLRALRLLRLLRLLSKTKFSSTAIHSMESSKRSKRMPFSMFCFFNCRRCNGRWRIEYLSHRKKCQRKYQSSFRWFLVGIGHTNHCWIRRHFTDNRTGKTHRWHIDDFGNVYCCPFRWCCRTYNAQFLFLVFERNNLECQQLMNHIIICNYNPEARMLLDAILEEIDENETKLVLLVKGRKASRYSLCF